MSKVLSFILILILAIAVSGTIAVQNTKAAGKIIGAYTVNERIFVNTVGEPEGKPITSGFQDYKPAWSKTGSMLVFFRIKENNADVSQWKNAICVIHTDGTGFRELTDGQYHDFNPTWTRDGKNRIIFDRYNTTTGLWGVYVTAPDAKPGDEQLISDSSVMEYAHSCLLDGRILILSTRGGPDSFKSDSYMFLLTWEPGKPSKYETIKFNYKLGGLPDRVSFSPNERKIVYELNETYSGFSFNGHPLVVADFDPATATCSNPRVITKAILSVCDIYPRWTKDETAIIYHSNRGGKYQLYKYDLAEQTTAKVSTDITANYAYFCGEDTPY